MQPQASPDPAGVPVWRASSDAWPRPLNRPRALLTFLAASLVPWLVLEYVLVSALGRLNPKEMWGDLLRMGISNGLAYWLLTPGVVVVAGIGAQLRSERRYRDATLLYLAGGVGFLGLHPVLRFGVDHIVGWIAGTQAPPFVPVFVRNLWNSCMLYSVLLCGATAFVYSLEARRHALRQSVLRAELAESRLRLLKAQIHPHFLFNTLHDISGLMETDIRAARNMMARLEDLLHIAITEQSDELIPLGQELKFLECYLDLEKMRLGDRLTVQMDIEETSLGAMVPSMVLQPIVENSIKHGIAKFSKRGWLRISSRREGLTLRLTVEDSGPGIADSATPGVGLANTEARLRHHYSTRQTIRYTNLPAGFRCEISLPFTAGPVAAEVENIVVAEYSL